MRRGTVFSFTAKRLRPKAQGCFNPGLARVQIQPQRGCVNRPNACLSLEALNTSGTFEATMGHTSVQTQPQQLVPMVATRSGLLRKLNTDPGLKQPWALGRNRFAVNAASQGKPKLKQIGNRQSEIGNNVIFSAPVIHP